MCSHVLLGVPALSSCCLALGTAADTSWNPAGPSTSSTTPLGMPNIVAGSFFLLLLLCAIHRVRRILEQRTHSSATWQTSLDQQPATRTSAQPQLVLMMLQLLLQTKGIVAAHCQHSAGSTVTGCWLQHTQTGRSPH